MRKMILVFAAGVLSGVFVVPIVISHLPTSAEVSSAAGSAVASATAAVKGSLPIVQRTSSK